MIQTRSNRKKNPTIINNIAISDSSSRWIYSDNKGFITVYNLNTGEYEYTISTAFDGSFNALFTKDPDIITYSNKTFDIILHSLSQNQTVKILSGHSAEITKLKIHSSRNLLLSSDKANLTYLWDWNQIKCLAKFKQSYAACFDYWGNCFLHVTKGMKNDFIVKIFNIINPNKIALTHDSYSLGHYTIDEIKKDEIFKDIQVTTDGNKIICLLKNEFLFVDLNKGLDEEYWVKKYQMNNNSNKNNNNNNNDIESYTGFDITKNAKYVIVGTSFGKVKLLSIDEGETLAEFDDIWGECTVVKFSQTHTFFVTGGNNWRIYALKI